MIKKFISYGFLLNVIFACICHAAPDTDMLPIKFYGDKRIIGRTEKVTLTEKGIQLDAKIDTGATMSSLSAESITIVKKGNTSWVNFIVYIPSTKKKLSFTKQLKGEVPILKRKEEYNDSENPKYSFRPVITLSICLGNQTKKIAVNLTDRKDFRYPMLIGRNAIKKFKYLVDVKQAYLFSPSECEVYHRNSSTVNPTL